MSINYDIEKVVRRPWKRHPGTNEVTPVFASPFGDPSLLDIARFQRPDDADFALQCVNHHEELVAMLERIVDADKRGMPAPSFHMRDARALLAKVRP